MNNAINVIVGAIVGVIIAVIMFFVFAALIVGASGGGSSF
jgi:hypothetical protein